MSDEKTPQHGDSDGRQELQEVIGGLLSQLAVIQESTARDRMLFDDRFRQETVSLLRRLEQAIDGHPSTTVLMLEQVRTTIAEQRQARDQRFDNLAKGVDCLGDALKEIAEAQKEVLALKEEMLPRWAKITLTYLVGGLSIVSATIFTAWWYLSDLAKNLPALLDFLNNKLPALIDLINRLLPTKP